VNNKFDCIDWLGWQVVVFSDSLLQ
jgi:hypothetical protein